MSHSRNILYYACIYVRTYYTVVIITYMLYCM